MVAVHFAMFVRTPSPVLEQTSFCAAVEKLMQQIGDIEAELPSNIPQKHLLYYPAKISKRSIPASKSK
jgi:hypothetical protein